VRGAAPGDGSGQPDFLDAHEDRSSNSSTTWYESTAIESASAGRGISASYHSAWAGSSRSAAAAAAGGDSDANNEEEDAGDAVSESGFTTPRSATGSFVSAAGSLHSAASNASFRTTRSQASTGSAASGAAVPTTAAGEPGGGALDMFGGGTPTAGAVVAEPALSATTTAATADARLLAASSSSVRGLQSALYRNAASFPAAFLPQFPAAGDEDSEDEALG
jgi:hypothetical protein